MRRAISSLAAIAFVATVGAAAAEPFTADEEARIRELALEALLEKPEILREAIKRLEAKEATAADARAKAAIIGLREELTADPNAPVVGNASGDVTVVEFMDYNCGYCKRAAPSIAALLESDDGLRLVYREWPILSDQSTAAARLALAAREQGAYEPMHDALMATPRVTEEIALAKAAELGLDVDRLKLDATSPAVESHLARTMQLARALGLSGTPAFIIGDTLIPGAAPLEDFQAAVAKARRSSND